VHGLTEGRIYFLRAHVLFDRSVLRGLEISVSFKRVKPIMQFSSDLQEHRCPSDSIFMVPQRPSNQNKLM
jgi:hypothetical protein